MNREKSLSEKIFSRNTSESVHDREEMTAVDENELNRIIQKYTPLVYSIVSGILGRERRADIEEVVADVFVAYWQADKYDTSDEGTKALLVTIARHHSINRTKQLRRNVWDELDDEIISAGLTDDEVADKIQAEMIRDVINSLPPPDNEIYTRRYFYCQSVKEIAKALGVKPKYVENRLYYAKSKIRRALLEYGIGGNSK